MEEEVSTGAGDVVVQAGKEMVEQTKTMLHLDELKKYLTWGNMMKVIVGIVTILIFYIAYRLIKRFVLKKATQKLQPHAKHMVNKIVSYVFYVLLIMYILSLFGVNLSALWGAAGVAGLAIGFAAQTSVSNLISGVFVLAEKALKVGDFISVGGVSGTVDNIGLLSVTVHTLDNQYVRIPNSSIINSNLTNFSHFPTRRLVFEIPISYDSDMQTALDALKKVPPLCPTVLTDPAPAVFYEGFGDAVNLRLAVWFKGSDLVQTKNDVYMNVVKVFNEDGVTIPFTRYDVKLVNDDSSKASAKKGAAKKLAEKSASALKVVSDDSPVSLPKPRGRAKAAKKE